MGEQTWPQWTTAPISVLARDEARNHLKAAQAFWRDFALAGLTIPELRQVIEERRRKGPGGRITVPSKPQAVQPKPSPGALLLADNSLFDDFPPLNPGDERWIHA